MIPIRKWNANLNITRGEGSRGNLTGEPHGILMLNPAAGCGGTKDSPFS